MLYMDTDDFTKCLQTAVLWDATCCLLISDTLSIFSGAKFAPPVLSCILWHIDRKRDTHDTLRPQ